MVALEKIDKDFIKALPKLSDSRGTYSFIRNSKVRGSVMVTLKRSYNSNDEVLALWLNMNVRTYRKFKRDSVSVVENSNTKEKAVKLLQLSSMGKQALGTFEGFQEWLKRENFHLDGAKPMDYLDSSTGINLIYNRLLAMDRGENV